MLLTTHDLADVERLCERLVIIDHGRVIEDGTVDGHQGALRHRAHRWSSTSPNRARRSTCRAPTVDRVEGPRQWLRFRRDDHSAASVARRGDRPVAEVRDLTVEEPAIDDVVRRIYAGETA